MPNAKCEKCNLLLDDILVKDKHYNRFIKLMKERVVKFAGFPCNITPGIRHNEIVLDNSWMCLNNICDGVLYYQPFTPSPKKYKFSLDMI
jgi:hypothetical protein